MALLRSGCVALSAAFWYDSLWGRLVGVKIMCLCVGMFGGYILRDVVWDTPFG